MRADFTQIWNTIMARRKRLREENRIGRVAFDADTVEFFFDEEGTKSRYWILRSELETPADQLRWLYHLRTKRWFTREVFGDLLDVLEHLGLRPPT